MIKTLTTPEAGAATLEQRQFRAFIKDDATRQVLDQVVGELAIPAASVHKGGIVEAIRLLGEQRSPRLLVVDISGVELPLSAVNELAEVCEPGVTVIAIGDRNDVGLFRDLVNNGVSDYLVKPISPTLIQKSLLNVVESATQSRQSDRRGRLIAVSGARGGVGSTMLATGVAWSIANRRRRRVALVDLDLQFGTVALALDLEPSPGLREALEHPGRIDALFVERAMVRQSDTLYVLSGEESLGDPVTADTSSLDILLKELRTKFHYVVVDLPRQVSPATQHVLQAATNQILVTDLSLAGMRDTRRPLTLLPTANAACQITVVANRIGEHREGEIARKEFEAAIGRPIDVLVPFDARSVAAATNVGRPVVDQRGKVAAAIQQVMERITGNPAAAPRRRALRLWPLGKR
ncbi:MAG: CpaE family protein [Geminicoccaceae bacterium]